ncbi:MAG: hypothetical protein O3B73_01155 [bacterium]|nr:hypothetical protein [bacterium]
MVSGIAALLGLIMVVVSKFFTTSKIQQIRRMVAEAQVGNNKIKTELKVAENNKAVALQNLKTEERIQRTLMLQVEKYTNELSSLEKK